MKIALFAFLLTSLFVASVAPSGQIVITVDELTQISQSGPDVIVSPNPASTQVRLTPVPLSLDIKSLEILDSQGETLFEATIGSQSQFEVNLPAGLYTLKIETDDAGVITKTLQVI